MADLDETVKGDMCFGDDAEVPYEPVIEGSVMAERVAEVLWKDRHPDVAWKSIAEIDRENYRGHARAAIEVMPIAALREALRIARLHAPLIRLAPERRHTIAVIDAALKTET